MPLQMPNFGTPAAPSGPTGSTLQMPNFSGRNVPDPNVPVDVPTPDETADSGIGGKLALLAGVLGAAGAAYYTRNTSGLVNKLKQLGGLFGNVRSQTMLSGLAAPKSFVGNLGAPLVAAAEEGSLAPIKAFYNPETVKDAVAAFKANVPATGMAAGPNWLPTPGRIMGALDEATQKALVRGGLTAENAERAALQTPLGGERFGNFGTMMQSPVANYVFPFRRTPFNQLYEGLSVLKPATMNKAGDKIIGELGTNNRTLAAISALGGLHGAATSNDKAPLSVPFGIAAAGRYGLPYGLAAVTGRYLMGGLGGGNIAGNVLPVSEYGIEEAPNVLGPFEDPAALRALRQLGLGGQ